MFAAEAPRESYLSPDTIISGDFGSYKVKAVIGEGTYGQVARCVELSTNLDVAVKFSKKHQIFSTRQEAKILQQFSSQSDRFNIVKFINSFRYQDYYCLVLEHLDRSVFDHIVNTRKSFQFSEISYVAEQLLVALNELSKHKLVHCDLKPDNVMLVNQKDEPFKVKLIDFGFTKSVSRLVPGSVIQAVGYRAPEAAIGFQLDTAVDMWSLGCTLAFMYLRKNLFPIWCEYQMMKMIVKNRGSPTQQHLKKGAFTKKFFTFEHGEYRLKTPQEYNADAYQHTMPESNNKDLYSCLEDLLSSQPQTEENDDLAKHFLDFLEQLLQVNPATRMSTKEALNHPFIRQRSNYKMPTPKYLQLASSLSPKEEGAHTSHAQRWFKNKVQPIITQRTRKVYVKVLSSEYESLKSTSSDLMSQKKIAWATPVDMTDSKTNNALKEGKAGMDKSVKTGTTNPTSQQNVAWATPVGMTDSKSSLLKKSPVGETGMDKRIKVHTFRKNGSGGTDNGFKEKMTENSGQKCHSKKGYVKVTKMFCTRLLKRLTGCKIWNIFSCCTAKQES